MVVFVVLVVLSLVLMVRSTYYQSSRLTAWTNGIAGDWYRGVNSVSGYFGLKAENDRLAAENAQLRAQMAESYISYTDSVFTVNDTVYKQRYTYTEARVIKNSWTQQNNYIMINKGSDLGVEPDMAVISPEGIVGIVVNTSRNFATIMPVLHSDSRNSVKVRRTGVSGSLVWDGLDYRYAQIVDITTAYQINEGDTIITPRAYLWALCTVPSPTRARASTRCASSLPRTSTSLTTSISSTTASARSNSR